MRRMSPEKFSPTDVDPCWNSAGQRRAKTLPMSDGISSSVHHPRSLKRVALTPSLRNSEFLAAHAAGFPRNPRADESSVTISPGNSHCMPNKRPLTHNKWASI